MQRRFITCLFNAINQASNSTSYKIAHTSTSTFKDLLYNCVYNIFLLFIMPKNNFEEPIPSLIEKPIPKQILEFYISSA